MILPCAGQEEQLKPKRRPEMGQIRENTPMLLIDSCVQNNQVEKVSRLMSFHKQYLDPFNKTQNFLLKGDGPLRYDYRHYIAIMASARLHCSYLVELQRQEFLLQRGDARWLNGQENVPQKLRDLNDINKILAHRPWLINKAHIEKLTRGKDNWSLSEVVHAMILLVHFHSLSSFVFGSLFHPDHDDYPQPGGDALHWPHSPTAATNGVSTDKLSKSPPQSGKCGVEELMKVMKSINEQREETCTSQEEMAKRFEKVGSPEVSQPPSPTMEKADIFGQYMDDPAFNYQDFAKRGEHTDIPTFRVQDYSWDDHGYSLVNRLYSDVGTLLDEKFKVAYNLTYYTMGRKNNVDTSTFRRAVWNYIQCIYGIRHDDYDYSEVNLLLDRNLKAYIKTVCCYPERVIKKDYDNVMKDFKHSEKIHVNLMLIEAKLQAELLYALRAIMCYMT